MDGQKPTLNDVAILLERLAVAFPRADSGYTDMAATVRAASELLARCIPLVKDATQFRSDCEGRNLLADIRKLLGESNG